MEALLENILDAISEDKITESQGMYLIYTHIKIDYPIEPEELLRLTRLKYIVNGKVGKVLLTSFSIVDPKLSGTIKPKYVNEISRQVTIKICKLLCVIDPKTKQPLLSGSNTHKDIIKYTAKHYLQKEELIAYHYIIFLFIFPIQSKSNRKWEKHFFPGFEYKGAKIRTRSAGTGGKFKKIVRTRDMGAFIYGTYLYMKSCIREGKAYVKTMHNYMDEYDDWYYEALEAIKEAKDVESLFKAPDANEGRLNVVIN